MISVQVRKNESIDHALRRFKRKCQQSGLIREVKKSSQYIKPSEKKKIAKRIARRRQRKRQSQR